MKAKMSTYAASVEAACDKGGKNGGANGGANVLGRRTFPVFMMGGIVVRPAPEMKFTTPGGNTCAQK